MLRAGPVQSSAVPQTLCHRGQQDGPAGGQEEPGGSEEPRGSDGHPCVCADRIQHGPADPAAQRDVRQRPAELLDVSSDTAEPYCYRNTQLTVRPKHAGSYQTVVWITYTEHEAEKQGVSAFLA